MKNNGLYDGWELLKTQIGLFSILVILVGIASTDSYYGFFGLTYQTMDLPLHHIAYRGVTTLMHDYQLFIPYAIAIILLLLDPSEVWGYGGLTVPSRSIIYAFLVVLIPLTFFIAIAAGERAAERESQAQTSTLPQLLYIADSSEKERSLKLTAEPLRLLGVSGSFLIVFTPSPDSYGRPITYFLNREGLAYYEISK